MLVQTPKAWMAEYARHGQALVWEVEPELQNFNELPEVTCRNHFVRTHLSDGLDHLLAIYLNLSLGDLRDLLSLVFRITLDQPLQGVGLELGAGTAAVSATLCALQPEVQGMLAVELCAEVAKEIIPAVSQRILGNQAGRVVPVVGSFNTLPLEGESVDFIVEMGSYHHSSDLLKTFATAFRVLKPGSILLCLDRCHPDSLSDVEVGRMLNLRYSREFLRSHGYPEDIVLTRRENGEHEYRLREWQVAAGDAGFVLERLLNLRHVPFKRALRGLFSILPHVLRERLYRSHDANLSTFLAWLRHGLGLMPCGDGLEKVFLAKKDLTVLTFRKPL